MTLDSPKFSINQGSNWLAVAKDTPPQKYSLNKNMIPKNAISLHLAYLFLSCSSASDPFSPITHKKKTSIGISSNKTNGTTIGKFSIKQNQYHQVSNSTFKTLSKSIPKKDTILINVCKIPGYSKRQLPTKNFKNSWNLDCVNELIIIYIKIYKELNSRLSNHNKCLKNNYYMIHSKKTLILSSQ